MRNTTKEIVLATFAVFRYSIWSITSSLSK